MIYVGIDVAKDKHDCFITPQESFFGHMKDEIMDKIAACDSFEGAKAIIDDYMDYYNANFAKKLH